MATDGQAFNKVKNLLNRMDRSIDEARDKRLGKGVAEGPMIGASSAPGGSGVSSSSGTLIGAGAGTSGSSTQGANGHVSNAGHSVSQVASNGSNSAGTQIGLNGGAADASKSGYGRAKPLARPATSSDNARRWGA